MAPPHIVVAVIRAKLKATQLASEALNVVLVLALHHHVHARPYGPVAGQATALVGVAPVGWAVDGALVLLVGPCDGPGTNTAVEAAGVVLVAACQEQVACLGYSGAAGRARSCKVGVIGAHWSKRGRSLRG